MRLLLSILLISSTFLYAKESAAYNRGATLYFANSCGNCHGTHAEGSSYYPRLANKKQKILIKKLQNFKKGIADTQKQEIMFTFAKPLSKKEIEDITYYLSHYKKEKTDKYEVEDDLLGVDY